MGAAEAESQTRVQGAVHDSLGKRGPLGQATVVLVERSQFATTDDRGHFAFHDVPAGLYHLGLLHAVLDSFDLQLPTRLIEVPASGTVWIDLAVPSASTAFRAACENWRPSVEAKADVVNFLKIRAVCVALARRAVTRDSVSMMTVTPAQDQARTHSLAPVVVRDSVRPRTVMGQSGFFERQRMGLGAFIAADALSRVSYGSTASLLSTVRGVHVEYGTSGKPTLYLVGSKDTYCVPAFFVDGALYHLPTPVLRRSTLRLGEAEGDAFDDIARTVPPASLIGIEVYSAPGAIPARFDYSSLIGCGSIVLWTR